MSRNTRENERRQKGHDQVTMRVYEDDRVRLEHLQTITGLLTEVEEGTHQGRSLCRLYLDDLLKISLDLLERYQGPGE